MADGTDNWTAFEGDEGRGVRAQKLDECLAVYDGLMRGQPFTCWWSIERGEEGLAEVRRRVQAGPPR